jgi:hypothetical protein
MQGTLVQKEDKKDKVVTYLQNEYKEKAKDKHTPEKEKKKKINYSCMGRLSV